VLIHQDALVYASILNGDDRLEHRLGSGRAAYAHLIRGRLSVNGVALSAGDALKIADENVVSLSQAEAAEVLLFDLPL
jgi:hypothetical protein